jgi:hypothetical protein
MTAIACLRIFVGKSARFPDPDALAALVAKVAGSYLEKTWLWPRHYDLAGPFSFELGDPTAATLDAHELRAMAGELRTKLFGEDGDGNVCLVMFEGDKVNVQRFARARFEELEAVLEGREDALITGRVCRITPEGVEVITPTHERASNAAMRALAERQKGPDSTLAFRGVFHAPRELFIGNIALRLDPDAPAVEALLPDRPRPEHDIDTLRSGTGAVAATDAGISFFPVCFSTLITPSGRSALAPALDALPKPLRRRLAAVIYDTPRSPSISALAQAKNFLEPYFGRLGLSITDPAFQIDDLPADLTNSVTLTLPASEEKVRLAVLARFLKDPFAYRRRRIWQGVDDVRTARELDLCIRAGVPFLSGPAITGRMARPLSPGPCAAGALPLTLATAPPVTNAIRAVA